MMSQVEEINKIGLLESSLLAKLRQEFTPLRDDDADARIDSGVEMNVQCRQIKVAHRKRQLLALSSLILLAASTAGCDANSKLAESEPHARGPVSPISAEITIDPSQTIRRVPSELFGTNIEWPVETVRIWDKDKDCLDAGSIALAASLPSTVVRFPGGTFSDYYHWQQGVGPRGKRPVQQHVLDEGKGPSLLGSDEFMDFCSRIKARPLLTANLVTGNAQEAADWVSYCNSPNNAQRQSNGHPAPYMVQLWELGNEQYMAPEGRTRQSSQLPEEYLEKYKQFATKMLAVDPSIKLAAVGGLNFGRYSLVKDNAWNTKVLRGLAASPTIRMDYLAVHNAYAPVLVTTPKQSTDEVYAAFLSAPILIEQNLRDVTRQLDELSPATQLAVTEWGPLFSIDLAHSPWMDHPKTLGSALFTASTLHSFMRVPRVTLANFFKLKDQVFMGTIGYNNVPKPTYYAFQLEAKNIGADVVPNKVKVASYASAGVGMVDAIKAVPYLDVLSTISPDRLHLAIDIINRSQTAPVATSIDCGQFTPQKSAHLLVISGENYDANNGADLPAVPFLKWPDQVAATHNPQLNKGKPGTVTIKESDMNISGNRFKIDLAPLSITRIELNRTSK